VLFNDALPITAVLTKMLFTISGERLNPFGWWVLLTYLLQGVMAVRLMWAFGVRSAWASIGAAVLAVTPCFFSLRLGHTALSSHFLILWGLALHVETLRHGSARLLEFWLLLALALMVNSYLFAMVFVLEAAALVALAARRQLDLGVVPRLAGGLAGIFGLALVMGYGRVVVHPALMRGQGFDLYSWNAITLWLPPGGIFGHFADISRDATGGQFEGESYIGAGALLVLISALVSDPRVALDYIRRYRILVWTLMGFTIYAASNQVYLGRTLLVSYYLPNWALDLGNYFRGSGRFIWPLAYCLALLPVAFVFRQWRPRAAVALTIVAIALQVHEALPIIKHIRAVSEYSHPDLIDTPRVNELLTEHKRIFQYPSWACGGLAGSKRRWGNLESNRELQVELAAARLGKPTNSAYMSRMVNDCEPELAWRDNPILLRGTLYLLGPEAVAASPKLTDLARSTACIPLGWAFACSEKWAQRP
jgi:hypothetical protein